MIFFVSFAHLRRRSKSSDVSITQSSFSSFCTRRRWVVPRKGDVTRDDSQRRFLAQHRVATLEQCCNHSKQCRNNVATLCCAKNRRCESSRVTSPWRNPESRKFCMWNLKSSKFLLVESGIVGFGIRNTAQGIRNPTIKRFEFHWQRLESGIHGMESRICYLGFSYNGPIEVS